MSINFLILLIFYTIIPFCILGYGFMFQKTLLKNYNNLSLGYFGLLGIFFLIIYSYLSNFLIPHSKIHNFVLLILGFIFFLKNISSYKIDKKIFNFFYLNFKNPEHKK